MILSELRDYIGERGCVPLGDLCRRFDVDEPTLRGMLGIWERKNKLRILPPGGTCSGCTTCSPGLRQVCEWIGD